MHLLLKGDDFINSQEIRYFYRNIVKTGNVYRVKHNNKDYGEFKKLSDALTSSSLQKKWSIFLRQCIKTEHFH